MVSRGSSSVPALEEKKCVNTHLTSNACNGCAAQTKEVNKKSRYATFINDRLFAVNTHSTALRGTSCTVFCAAPKVRPKHEWIVNDAGDSAIDDATTSLRESEHWLIQHRCILVNDSLPFMPPPLSSSSPKKAAWDGRENVYRAHNCSSYLPRVAHVATFSRPIIALLCASSARPTESNAVFFSFSIDPFTVCVSCLVKHLNHLEDLRGGAGRVGKRL